MRFLEIINQWFKDEWAGSLVLPDGWYGRPHDNQHALTSADEIGNDLNLILDQKITLRFSGIKSVKVIDRELVFGPFDSLRFECEVSREASGPMVKQYQSGEVKIVPAPG